jgi:S1-C subfamily serine protease
VLLVPPAAARGVEASPRAVTPHGELAADERANIDVFKATSPSLVHITTLERAASFFSFNVQQVPIGTGTAFMWDDRGHVVTNFHVVQGADDARVTLSDQSVHSASLVGVFPSATTPPSTVPAAPARA